MTSPIPTQEATDDWVEHQPQRAVVEDWYWNAHGPLRVGAPELMVLRGYFIGVLKTEPEILESFAEHEGLLYCPLHEKWLDPPDATHRGHPELDPVNSGEACGNAVDPYRALRFMVEDRSRRG